MSDLLGSSSGSDLEIYRRSRLRTQIPVDLKERSSNRLSLTDRRRDDAPSSTPFLAIMDRLPGFERPYEPLPTSYRTRTKAGTTHRAAGDHWEPQDAHLSRNSKRIQPIRSLQRKDTAVILRQASPPMTTLSPRSPPIWS